MDVRPRAHDQNRRAAVSGPLFITGHAGLAGSALRRAMPGRDIITASRGELDLKNADAVAAFLQHHRPSAIIHAAARNAGITLHEAEPAALLADNLAIAVNVIRAAADARVPRLLYISSAVVYAAADTQPLAETCAATTLPGGPTAGYALAKIAGMALCEAVRKQHGLTFHSIIPCNLYGPGDNYHPQHATVVAGMMRRMHQAAHTSAPEFPIWGSGRQTREFLHADDLAAACLLLLDRSAPPPRVNCSPGISTAMFEIADHLKAVTGYTGTLVPDSSKPEGAPRPPLDCTLIRSLGWQPRIALPDGLCSTYAAFNAAIHAGNLRGAQ